MEIQSYPKLSALISEVHNTHEHGNKTDTLMNILTKNHYWPYIQLKYFSSKSSLVMLHNVYKQDVPIPDKELYDECRSVILDMNAPDGSNIIQSLSKKIPKRITKEMAKDINDNIAVIETGFEGTMVYMYHHDDKWYISTSTCPSIDRSRYFSPNKSHGNMLDQALTKMFPEMRFDNEVSNTDKSKMLRTKFFDLLDKQKSYSFILVHHENGYIMDYTSSLGEHYANLVHINTRNSNMEQSIEVIPELQNIGVMYTTKYTTLEEAMDAITNDSQIYAIMVHTDNELYKISTNDILRKEEDNLGHPNPWMNLLWVYMQNKPHIRMEYYLENHPEINNILDATTSRGVIIAPTRVVAKVITSIRDILYTLYRSTTYYYKTTKTYKMDKAYDQQLPPILRFHLAQLRYIQTNFHTEGPITRKAIHHYLCHHQTMKNIRLLIEAFTNNPSIHNMDQETADCFYILNKNLKNNFK